MPDSTPERRREGFPYNLPVDQGSVQQPSTLQLHTLLHTRRVEAEIGDGDLAAGIGTICGLFEAPIGLLELARFPVYSMRALKSRRSGASDP
jgi:hypothetical protein